jgi:hypothetical protein
VPALFLTLAAAVGAFLVSRRRRRRTLPAQAMIVSPQHSSQHSSVTAADGVVRSMQCAEISLSPGNLELLWSAANLENLARTYWLFLTRVTLGLIRVVYGHDERRVVLLARPLTLLRFEPPEYLIEPNHGKVTWKIRDGLLVARAGRGSGYLALDVRRLEGQQNGSAKVRIEVEVANFYPAIAAGFSVPVYEATQSSIHVIVTHAFLRSLARLKLAPSRVGRLRRAAGAAAGPRRRSPHP